ncbi:similar to RIKEN cDNA 2510038A11 (predicted), isoform CRA_a [Rattus norvegicus]|uniref:Active regulator of SIRT1 n=1 Tax=Rattus norvegicus TaxID=10116 RepID=A6HSW8_RAT|nr:similar to RIKEN cDNA 2510038A11 (predicted), isoform CRA_a [Rattus norvegicus]|eukprot:NP_001124050.1 active regulator of SIRT1 [Rattus norvegicus]
MSAALLRRGLELLEASEAPRAVPGQAKASGTPVKQTRRARAKAKQAVKLRNSAKGKVPKSALGELGKKTPSASQDLGQRLRVGVPEVTRDSTRKR